MLRIIVFSVPLALMACTPVVPPPNTVIAEAEAGEIARSVVPVTTPLRLQLRPTSAIRMQFVMTMALGTNTFVAKSPYVVEVQSLGDQLLVSGTVETMEVTAQNRTVHLDCGRDPLFRMEYKVALDGRLIGMDIRSSPGCQASEEFAAKPDNLPNLAFYILPSEGITTGTTLVPQTTKSGASLRKQDTRMIVAGQSDWHGRPVLVMRPVGCFSAEADGEPIEMCPHGVAMLDIAAGMPIGGILAANTTVRGMRITTIMRMNPD